MLEREPHHYWDCPKCGERLEAAGPASLNWKQQQHEYWEHDRKERNVAMPGGGAIPKPSSVIDVLVGGRAALDDAYYDGARLSSFDWGFLKAAHLDWKKQDLNP
jgi:hypothetical protein